MSDFNKQTPQTPPPTGTPSIRDGGGQIIKR